MSLTATITEDAAQAGPGPVPQSERLISLDVLRGVSLLGVVVANVWLFFSGAFLQFGKHVSQLSTLSADTLAFLVISLLISGKAMTTLSFLFGYGFGLQVERSQARGAPISATYVRRLAALLLIGALHAMLLWFGDILSIYAIAGFGLLAFRRATDRAVFVWALVFLFLGPMLVAAAPLLLGSRLPPRMPPPEVALPLLEILQTGSYTEVLRAHLQLYVMRWPQWTMSALQSLGLFLLGLWAVRNRLITKTPSRPRRRLWVALATILCGILSTLALEAFAPRGVPWGRFVFGPLRTLAMLGMVFGYVSLALLLLERARWRRVLELFVPAGRMPLTIYLSQTVACLAIFYGGGLVGRTGPALGLAISLALFAVQVFFARAWLRRFQFGPMEWLWRSITYGRAQPMRAPVAAR